MGWCWIWGCPIWMAGWCWNGCAPATPPPRLRCMSSRLEVPRAAMPNWGGGPHQVKPVVRETIEQVLDKLVESGPHPPPLLVVEDDAVVRRYFRSLLERQGVEVTEADNGASGLRALAARRFDCIVLDLGLPDMDGRSFCQSATARRRVGRR